MSQYVEADPDWAAWLGAPGPQDIDPEPIDVRTWAEQSADAVLGDAGLEPAADDRERLVRMLELVGARSYPAGSPWVTKWVHLPTWDDVPLAVVLDLFTPESVGGTDQADSLRILVGAHDPAVAEEPRIEAVTTSLGDGVRALVYGQSADQLTSVLTWAWPIMLGGEALYARLWTSFDPARVISAADDVDALARSLHVADDGRPG